MENGVGWDFEDLLLLVADYDAERDSLAESLEASEPSNPLNRLKLSPMHFRGTDEIEEFIEFLIEIAHMPTRYNPHLGDVLATAILRTNDLRCVKHPRIRRLMNDLFTVLEAKHSDILAKLVFDTCRNELST